MVLRMGGVHVPIEKGMQITRHRFYFSFVVGGAFYVYSCFFLLMSMFVCFKLFSCFVGMQRVMQSLTHRIPKWTTEPILQSLETVQS
jgi:hypothetical protein